MATDTELVIQARSGNAEAWKALYQRHFPSVWRYAYTLINEVHQTEDVVSETMLALLKGINSIDGEATKISAWLRSVVRHKVADHHRRNYRFRQRMEQIEADKSQSASDRCPAEDLATEETRRQITQVLESLSEKHRLVLEWKYQDGQRVRAIAERLGETEKAVEATLYRARREFRKKFQFVDPAHNERHAQESGTD